MCEISGCEKPPANRSLCWGHYQKLRKYGDPLGGKDPRRKRDHPLYETWRGMIARCQDKNNPYYGAVGISVCDRWKGIRGFWHFVDDMGLKPKGHTLERSNNNLGYSPQNCLWTTWQEQRRNSRDRRFMQMHRIECEVCHQVFASRRRDAKTCSNNCRVKKSYRQRKEAT
jgi:hypothetical protein